MDEMKITNLTLIRPAVMFLVLLSLFFYSLSATLLAGEKSGEIEKRIVLPVHRQYVAFSKSLKETVIKITEPEPTPTIYPSPTEIPITAASEVPTNIVPTLFKTQPKKIPTNSPVQTSQSYEDALKAQQDWFDSKRAQDLQTQKDWQKQMEEFKKQSDQNLKDFDKQAQQGMQDFQKQSEQQMSEFKQKYGF